MRRRFLSMHPGVVALCCLAGSGCADVPTSPDAALLGKAPSAPTVSSVSPNSAPQDTTLDVQVLGSGFDRGSKAEWALAGVVDPAKVRTNSTTYVSSTELRANITISLDALAATYDIIVTSSTGKKGVGTEMFAVRSKNADPGLAPSGTLDAPANRINGLNEQGWMVGTIDGSPRRSFVVAPGSTTPTILPPPGASSHDAWYIGDNNIIAGVQGGSAFVWRPSTDGNWSVELLSSPTGLITDGLGARLNKSGSFGARGAWASVGAPKVPLMWDFRVIPATFHVLPLPANTYSAIATGVNDAGVIIGTLNATSTAPVAAIYWPNRDSGPVQLPLYPGASSQQPLAINNAGLIAGWVILPVNRSTTAKYVAIWTPSPSGEYVSAPSIISPAGSPNDPKVNEAGEVLFSVDGVNYLWRSNGAVKLAPLSGGTSYAGSATSKLVSGETRVVGYTITVSSGTQLAVPTIWTVP